MLILIYKCCRNSGHLIPSKGLGTWRAPSSAVYDAVITAIKAGYVSNVGAIMYEEFLTMYLLSILSSAINILTQHLFVSDLYHYPCIERPCTNNTSFIDGNEKEVGQAIKDSGFPRSELFITTKLWNTCHRPELVKPALETSLANLQLDYLDLYLMHW